VLRGHEAGVSFAAFAPGGKRIVTASSDKTARVWDASGGKELVLLRGHESGLSSPCSARRHAHPHYVFGRPVWDSVPYRSGLLQSREHERLRQEWSRLGNPQHARRCRQQLRQRRPFDRGAGGQYRRYQHNPADGGVAAISRTAVQLERALRRVV